MTTHALETIDLTKYYGSKKAIDKLNLEIHQGEVFGFLGPNGAGKTTTIRILLNFIRATSGSAKVLGFDVEKNSVEIKKHIAYLPSEFGLQPSLTVGKCFEHYANFCHKGVSRKNYPDLAERFHLELDKKFRDLSHGMKQKAAIILAFMKEPELLILDEPTQGLDPLMQEEFYRLVKEQREAGRTVFLSSHLLTEVEKVCQRCAIIRSGELVEVEEVAVLRKRRFKKVELELAEEKDLSDLEKLPGVQRIEGEGRHYTIHLKEELMPALREIGQWEVEDITVENPSLEEIFMEYYRSQ